MPTDIGVSTSDSILDTFLDAYKFKKQIDLESKNDDRNIPDRVDVASGVTAKGGVGGGTAQASLPTWAWIAIAVGAVVGGGLLLKALK